MLNVGRNPSGQNHFLAVANGDVAMTFGTSAALGTIYQFISQFPNVEIGVASTPRPDRRGRHRRRRVVVHDDQDFG